MALAGIQGKMSESGHTLPKASASAAIHRAAILDAVHDKGFATFCSLWLSSCLPFSLLQDHVGFKGQGPSIIGFQQASLPEACSPNSACCGRGGRSQQADEQAGRAPATGKNLRPAAKFQPGGNIAGVYNPAQEAAGRESSTTPLIPPHDS